MKATTFTGKPGEEEKGRRMIITTDSSWHF
jgi:hypothetical protein